MRHKRERTTKGAQTRRDARPAWIAWERQRRSETLARAFDAEYLPLVSRLPGFLRYAVLAAQSVRLLVSRRHGVVYVQNPSVVLAAIACALRGPLDLFIVVDRHSNFELETRSTRSLKWMVFHSLSRYSNAAADLTIVTNEFLKQTVEEDGGRAFVLQDKLPVLPVGRQDLGRQGPVGAVICTFSPDEPIDEVIRAANLVNSDVRLYITGKPKLSTGRSEMLRAASGRVKLTGFLPEADYASLIAGADFVVVLTTQEHTLVCGAYEAISLGKPMVLSDTVAIRQYFSRGAAYTDATAPSIARAIERVIESRAELEAAVIKQREWMQHDWNMRFDRLRAILAERAGGVH